MKTQLKIPRPCLVQLNRLLKIFLMPIQSKAFPGPVKSIPKDFLDEDSVDSFIVTIEVVIAQGSLIVTVEVVIAQGSLIVTVEVVITQGSLIVPLRL